MAKCVVRDWQGKESGQAELDLAVAKETTAPDLLHRAVVRQLAHARQGTASTLTRAEVAGGDESPTSRRAQDELVRVRSAPPSAQVVALFSAPSRAPIPCLLIARSAASPSALP